MALSSETSQFLTFRLADGVYALDIGKVREVLDLGAVTRVPRTPGFLCGVINLRGSVVPVADLRVRFDMSRTEKTVNTSVIITEIAVEGETVVLGVLADAVEEVIELEQRNIAPPPKIGTGVRSDFITGMADQDDRFLVILDIDKVFSSDDIALVRPAGTSAGPGQQGRP